MHFFTVTAALYGAIVAFSKGVSCTSHWDPELSELYARFAEVDDFLYDPIIARDRSVLHRLGNIVPTITTHVKLARARRVRKKTARKGKALMDAGKEVPEAIAAKILEANVDERRHWQKLASFKDPQM